MNRFENLNEKDLKALEDETIFSRFYQILEFTLGASATANDSVLTIILHLAVKMLKSANRSMKLNGIKILNRMISSKKAEKGVDLTWKNKKSLLDEFSKSDVVQAIFGETAHEEVIKQSGEILMLLINGSEFTTKHLESIWKCCTEKHENISEVCFELLSILLLYLPLTVCYFLCPLFSASKFIAYPNNTI